MRALVEGQGCSGGWSVEQGKEKWGESGEEKIEGTKERR